MSPADSEVVAELQAIFVNDCISYAMSALVAYEYIITLRQEATMVWLRKWTIATWLFMVNRYMTIAVAILGSSPSTAKRCMKIPRSRISSRANSTIVCYSCTNSMVLYDALVIGQYVIFAIFSALRIYAVWNRNIPIAILIMGLNLVPAATTIYVYTQTTVVFSQDAVLGTFCNNNVNLPASLDFDLELGTRLAVITADIIVLALTWRKTYKNWVGGMLIGMDTPLSHMLIRDGTIYFGALLVMNIAQVFVRDLPGLQNLSPVLSIIEILTPLLISRFLLNLRQLREPEGTGTHEISNSRFSVPAFRVPTLASIAGNMGEDLRHGPTPDEGDDQGDEEMDGDIDESAENSAVLRAER